ncbi:MAG: MBL fold metallo-hydrolase [Bdellovibrionales bacterium]
MKPSVQEYFDKATWTLTYVVFDPSSKDAIIIDPVMDYDPASSMVAMKALEAPTQFLKDKGLKLHFILETHAHADHLSGAQELKKRFPGAKTGIGRNITKVQEVFKGVFNLGSDFATDGRQFDVLLTDSDPLRAGTLEIKTIFTPGHTPACATYVIGDAVFTGDALFMPDYGTGRCDFPAGSAEDLFDSVHSKIYELPDGYRVFTGHDYQPGGREVRFMATIAEEKKSNVQLKAGTKKEEFVRYRQARDAKLEAPRLLLPSVQVNIDGGKIPPPEKNGVSYLKIPVRFKA